MSNTYLNLLYNECKQPLRDKEHAQSRRAEINRLVNVNRYYPNTINFIYDYILCLHYLGLYETQMELHQRHLEQARSALENKVTYGKIGMNVYNEDSSQHLHYVTIVKHMNGTALCLSNLERYEESNETLNELLELIQQNGAPSLLFREHDVLQSISLNYVHMGDIDKAKEFLERALELNSGIHDGYVVKFAKAAGINNLSKTAQTKLNGALISREDDKKQYEEIIAKKKKECEDPNLSSWARSEASNELATCKLFYMSILSDIAIYSFLIGDTEKASKNRQKVLELWEDLKFYKSNRWIWQNTQENIEFIGNSDISGTQPEPV